MKKCRAQIIAFMAFILSYLGILLYFLTLRPGGASGNPVIIWALTAFASGGMLFMAIFALTLYLFRHREKAALYFALLCVSAAVRFFFMEGSQTIMGLIPEFPHSAVYAARYTAIGFFIIGITGFIYEYFSPPKKFARPFHILRAVTFAAYILHAVSSAFHGGDNGLTRLVVVLPTLCVQAYSLFIIAKSPAFKANRLNQFYFVTVLAYMAEAVLLGAFLSRFANVGVVTQSFFVIVHTVLLSQRYTEAITDNELLKRLNRAKSDFLHDMSHEMKAPLTVIGIGVEYAQRLMSKNGDMSEVNDSLESARNEVQRLGRMIKGMVELASLDEVGANRERTNFAELLALCADGLKRMAERKNTEITLTTAPGMPNVFVERERLSQAVACLLTNALSNTFDGRIAITAGFDNSFITTRMSGGEISEEGLLVCKTVLEAHGGTLEVKPEADSGTAVVFTVPVYGGQEAGHGN